MNRKFLLPIMVALGILGIGLCPALAADDSGGRKSSTILVQTATLTQKTLPVQMTTYGTVQPDTGNTVHVVVPRAGQVAKLVVSPGQEVRRGQKLFEFATGAATLLTYQQAVSAVKFARADLARMQELFKEKLTTNSQLATSEKALSDAQQTLKAQEDVGAGQPTQWVLSPADAVVTEVTAKVGDRLDQGGAVLQLTERGAVQVMLGVEPEQAGKVHVGMPVEIASVFGDAHAVNGHVDGVHGVIDPQTRLVDVVARLEGNASNGLLPGMRVKGVITLATVTGSVVPRQAVLSDEDGAYVYQINDGQAVRVNVKILLDTDDVYAIDGKLDPKQKLVTLGNYELSDGQAVREANAGTKAQPGK
ncbi:MAG: efflux RND transporter periplasmic adaptor subunit [Casimicrobiaceae bacterium]